MRHARRTLFGGAMLLAAIATAPVARAQAPAIRIGSKNFTEQFVVAEIYAQALEHAGFKVVRKLNLGGTAIAHQAMVSGDIDLYPEYTGTALVAVLKGEVVSDPAKVYDAVKTGYATRFGLTWLAPTRVNNGYAIIVRGDTAAADHLKTLSDLAGVAKTLAVGAGPEFLDRKDGLPGLRATYGIEFKDFRQFAKLGLRYDALEAKQIDVANGFVDEAIRMGDRLAIMRAGRLVQYDTPDAVLACPADGFVEAFLGTDRALRRLGLRCVAQLMQPAVDAPAASASVPPDATLREALSAMLGVDAAWLDVVDEGGTRVGRIGRDAILTPLGTPRA